MHPKKALQGLFIPGLVSALGKALLVALLLGVGANARAGANLTVRSLTSGPLKFDLSSENYPPRDAKTSAVLPFPALYPAQSPLEGIYHLRVQNDQPRAWTLRLKLGPTPGIPLDRLEYRINAGQGFGPWFSGRDQQFIALEPAGRVGKFDYKVQFRLKLQGDEVSLKLSASLRFEVQLQDPLPTG